MRWEQVSPLDDSDCLNLKSEWPGKTHLSGFPTRVIGKIVEQPRPCSRLLAQQLLAPADPLLRVSSGVRALQEAPLLRRLPAGGGASFSDR